MLCEPFFPASTSASIRAVPPAWWCSSFQYPAPPDRTLGNNLFRNLPQVLSVVEASASALLQSASGLNHHTQHHRSHRVSPSDRHHVLARTLLLKMCTIRGLQLLHMRVDPADEEQNFLCSLLVSEGPTRTSPHLGFRHPSPAKRI